MVQWRPSSRLSSCALLLFHSGRRSGVSLNILWGESQSFTMYYLYTGRQQAAPLYGLAPSFLVYFLVLFSFILFSFVNVFLWSELVDSRDDHTSPLVLVFPSPAWSVHAPAFGLFLLIPHTPCPLYLGLSHPPSPSLQLFGTASRRPS